MEILKEILDEYQVEAKKVLQRFYQECNNLNSSHVEDNNSLTNLSSTKLYDHSKSTVESLSKSSVLPNENEFSIKIINKVNQEPQNLKVSTSEEKRLFPDNSVFQINNLDNKNDSKTEENKIIFEETVVDCTFLCDPNKLSLKNITTNPNKENEFFDNNNSNVKTSKFIIEESVIDETVLFDTKIVESSIMNESTLLFNRKRRAKRKIGQKYIKRPLEIIEEFIDSVKRIKTDFEPNYFEELISQKNIEQQLIIEELQGEIQKIRFDLIEKNEEIKNLKQQLLDSNKQIQELLSSQLELKAHEEGSKVANAINSNNQENKKESIRNSGIVVVLNSTNSSKKEINIDQEKNFTIQSSKPIVNTSNLFTENIPEMDICFEESCRIKYNINDFISKARKEFIRKKSSATLKEKIQSLKTNNYNFSNKTGDFPSAFNTASNNKIKIDDKRIINAHKIYKQSIDFQSIQCDIKQYVPKTFIPYYHGDDEFHSEEKKFEPAMFTKDPKLMYLVKKQVHEEIRKFFGNQSDIDVRFIFNNLENVTNESPNKFKRMA